MPYTRDASEAEQEQDQQEPPPHRWGRGPRRWFVEAEVLRVERGHRRSLLRHQDAESVGDRVRDIRAGQGATLDVPFSGRSETLPSTCAAGRPVGEAESQPRASPIARKTGRRRHTRLAQVAMGVLLAYREDRSDGTYPDLHED